MRDQVKVRPNQLPLDLMTWRTWEALGKLFGKYSVGGKICTRVSRLGENKDGE